MAGTATPLVAPAQAQPLPRLLVTTDIGGDPDDIQSMIRLLAHVDRFQVEGLIASASGTPGENADATPRTDLIHALIDAYEPHYDMFFQHTLFPATPADLRERVFAGNAQRGVSALGPGAATAGSNRIIAAVDASTEPLHVAIWGGATELAQALHDVRATRTPAQVEAFVTKLRVVAIGDQDGWVDPAQGTGAWVREHFPKLRYLDAGLNSENRFDGMYRGFYQNDSVNFESPAVPLVSDEVAPLNQRAWVEANVINGHGELGALYPIVSQIPNTARNGSGVKEGDTISFLYLMENGLNHPDEPSWGGWGGRYEPTTDNPNHFKPAQDRLPDGTVNAGAQAKWSVARFRAAQQHEFAARMDWFVSDYSDANHAPQRFGGYAPVELRLDPAPSVTLASLNWFDPDGDALSYRWWFYEEASIGTLSAAALDALALADAAQVTVDLTGVAGGSTLHLIVEVADGHANTPLTRYQRFVVHIGSRVIPEPGHLGAAGALLLGGRRRRT